MSNIAIDHSILHMRFATGALHIHHGKFAGLSTSEKLSNNNFGSMLMKYLNYLSFELGALCTLDFEVYNGHGKTNIFINFVRVEISSLDQIVRF